MAAGSDPTTYRCTACGCETLPPLFRTVVAEFEALSEREKEGIRHILFGYRIYGLEGIQRGWINELADCVRAFLPSFFDAAELGDIGNVILSANDPDSARDRPAARAEAEES